MPGPTGPEVAVLISTIGAAPATPIAIHVTANINCFTKSPASRA